MPLAVTAYGSASVSASEGREEDAADGFASFYTVNEVGPGPSLAAAIAFDQLAREEGKLTLEGLSSDHPVTQQRVFNFLCYLEGSDPKKFYGPLVGAGYRPKTRAPLCPQAGAMLDHGRALSGPLPAPTEMVDADGNAQPLVHKCSGDGRRQNPRSSEGLSAVLPYVSRQDMNDTDNRENSGDRRSRDQQELFDGERKVPDSGRTGNRRKDDGAEEACAE